MSRVLPAQPNLEYLKKEAKDLLPELQQQNPSAQLSDAQHELARDYGFASWPKLKAHVEAVAPPVESPLAGTWIANVAKSTRHPYNQFRNATIHFAVSGDTVTIIDDVVNESGQPERRENTIVVDGKPREQQYGYILSARWLDPRTLETEATQNDERVGMGQI